MDVCMYVWQLDMCLFGEMAMRYSVDRRWRKTRFRTRVSETSKLHVEKFLGWPSRSGSCRYVETCRGASMIWYEYDEQSMILLLWLEPMIFWSQTLCRLPVIRNTWWISEYEVNPDSVNVSCWIWRGRWRRSEIVVSHWFHSNWFLMK